MSSFNLIVFTICMLLCAGYSSADHCARVQDAISDGSKLETVQWKTMHSNCTQEVKVQITKELNAAMIYLNLGAYFATDIVNRPGFAKFFFESASEERQHLIKLIDYLSMRGESVTDIAELITLNIQAMPGIPTKGLNGKEALEKALEQEVLVTKNVLKVMRICEAEKLTDEEENKAILPNDYHLVDWLTSEFLDEQYKGQRDIAGKLSTLMKLGSNNYHLGEFLYDKKLLSNEA